MPANRPLPSWWRAPRKRFVRMLKRRARPALNRFFARHSEVGDPTVFEPGTFPWEKVLVDHWPEIRREAEAVLRLRDRVPAFHEVSPDQYRISQEADWKTFWLHGFGERSEACCRMCPVTDRVVSEIPGLETAFFSMMAPGTHVIAHRGVSKAIINCHLGLIVPDDAERCHMRVGKQHFHWEPGELRIFDDTRKHEVWNETRQERVVLMLQFRRPLRGVARPVRDLFLRGLRYTPYIARAVANQRRFDARLEAALAASGSPSVG
jgi:beta-hydroxylase